jgi:tetratricopeptide (TPR) repeat protein
MDEQRLQAYLTLINALLTCPSGEEGQILQDNAEFVDAGLVATMAQVAEALAERGDENAAQFLIGLANQLGEFLGLSASTATPGAQLRFLMQVLQATLESRGNPQVVYPLLQQNLHLLDDNFAQILYDWGTATLAEVETEQAQFITATIGEFSNLIGQFPLGSQPTNLEIAIKGCEVILTLFTRENHSETWATTQNNLGNAYSNRIRGERAENIELAIAFYQAALQVRTRDAFPSDWADTQNNLGNAYSNRIRGERAENIESAIASYQAALEVRTRDAFPSQWATTQNNLGLAYGDRIRGKRAENIETAIAYFKAALEVRTREAFPSDWAGTQNNLGAAYGDRIRGERAENLESAIASFQAALEVRTREAFPQDYIQTQFNLGRAYRNAQQLDNAYHAFAAAIDTIEFQRVEISLGTANDADKQKLAEEWNRLYVNMIEVCLELADNTQAWEYIERSKTRNLIDSLTHRSLYPDGQISTQRQEELQQLQEEIWSEQRRLNQLQAAGEQKLSEKSITVDEIDYSHINQLRQRYNELYPYKPLKFDQLSTLIDKNTAIIEWYIFPDCFRAVIITANNGNLGNNNQNSKPLSSQERAAMNISAYPTVSC